ncbi:MAG: riboflavin synthase [bacterium]|nr:riboflavin synthase [bacterium]
MFTGIVQTVAPIFSVAKMGECLRVCIKKPLGWKLVPGQSIAVDGVCSTVTRISPSTRSLSSPSETHPSESKTGRKSQSFFEVEYMQETLAKTTVKTFEKNQVVNLERSLTLKDFVDGGLVQGHVDACGEVKKIERKGKTALLEIAISRTLKKYVATKGSVTINGVNLTVVQAKSNTFSVALIPYTLLHTNLGFLKKGDVVNVEVDMLARYVEKMMQDKR